MHGLVVFSDRVASFFEHVVCSDFVFHMCRFTLQSRCRTANFWFACAAPLDIRVVPSSARGNRTHTQLGVCVTGCEVRPAFLRCFVTWFQVGCMDTRCEVRPAFLHCFVTWFQVGSMDTLFGNDMRSRSHPVDAQLRSDVTPRCRRRQRGAVERVPRPPLARRPS